MDNIIKKIDALIDQIQSSARVQEDLDHYLLKQLRDYRRIIKENPSSIEVNNATRALVRFCTESMEWRSELYKSCMEITSLGEKLSKS